MNPVVTLHQQTFPGLGGIRTTLSGFRFCKIMAINLVHPKNTSAVVLLCHLLLLSDAHLQPGAQRELGNCITEPFVLSLQAQAT